MARYPGLVVLHDGQLHHSRARALIARGREDDYRAEFAFCHPEAPRRPRRVRRERAAGVAVFPVAHARRGPCGRHARSRCTAGGSPTRSDPSYLTGCRCSRSRWARARTHRTGGRRSRAPRSSPPSVASRPRSGFRNCCARLPGCVEVAPAARLLLVGETRDYYDVAAEAADLGIASRVTITGYVPDESLDAWIEAADVCVCLRWPTSRETSASWLRCLSAGKATIVDRPRAHGRGSLARPANVAGPVGVVAGRPTGRTVLPRPTPVCVAIDILDEDHSLGLALRRLGDRRGVEGVAGSRPRASGGKPTTRWRT